MAAAEMLVCGLIVSGILEVGTSGGAGNKMLNKLRKVKCNNTSWEYHWDEEGLDYLALCDDHCSPKVCT